MHFNFTQAEIRIIHNHTLIMTIWNAFFVLYESSVLNFSSGVLYVGVFFVYLPKCLGEMHDLSVK
jgi:hypothetical protein